MPGSQDQVDNDGEEKCENKKAARDKQATCEVRTKLLIRQGEEQREEQVERLHTCWVSKAKERSIRK